MALVGAMADALAHRGPDGAGTWASDDVDVAFGHRRLAVLDLSATGAQPMISRCARWVLVYNGEIYDHRSVRAELESVGVRFRGSSDTEVLLEAIATWGVRRALERVNGMFGLAVWDAQERCLTLARDRLGEKPLYWSEPRLSPTGTLHFGSELAALRAVPDLDLRIDTRSASAVLNRSFVPHPHTIYDGVHQVEPGGLVTVQTGGDLLHVSHSRWWDLAAAVEQAFDDRSAGRSASDEELISLLADAVELRLESDVPLGAFLSGGIDSSLIAALAQRSLGSRKLRTFTIAIPDIGLDESATAHRIASHIGTDHTTVALSAGDAVRLIPTLPQIWDEPFADPSMVPTALLTAAARRDHAVCLSGDGGDELFAGYNRHAFGASLERRARRLPAPVKHGLGRAITATPTSLIDNAARLMPPGRRIPALGDKMHKAGVLLASRGSTWDSLAQVWPRQDLPTDPHPIDRTRINRRLDNVETMLVADTAAVLPDQMLVKVDRASMAVGLEVRVPLLDHRLLRAAWSLPTEAKTSGGVGKVVLRRLVRDLLPLDVAGKVKTGFDPPLARWLRADLRDWAGDLLTAPRSVDLGLIGAADVRSVWGEHQSGRRNHDYRLWAVLMMEAWLAAHHP